MNGVGGTTYSGSDVRFQNCVFWGFNGTSNCAIVGTSDWIFATFGTLAIDTWTTLAAPDGTWVPEYNANADGIHPNDAGHAVIASRVIAAVLAD
jgi:hypothetical protein